MIRKPSQVTDPEAVRKAIERCDKMGRRAFREHYGFGEARTYFLRYNGSTYDSKAIVGVAFGIEHGTAPLHSDDFSGGAATVKPVLEKLGFVVVPSDPGSAPPPYRSQLLDVGEVYTRAELMEIFDIKDASINNGVFRPKNSKSIWLFVTRDKTADRPQLIDSLDGDVLHWSGQPAGRTDHLIIDHLTNGDEVLLFYRESRSQFPGSGFRYEGPFNYRSHSGAKPAAFILDRDPTAGLERKVAAKEDEFDPLNVADGRAQTLALVRRRQGQGKFRANLLEAYGRRCAITGCDFEPLLEAAHIFPYRGKDTNRVTNGLLLRADIHTLFDLGLIGINADLTIDVCPSLKSTVYEKFEPLRVPKRASDRPSSAALEWHLRTLASPGARAAILKRLSK